MMVLFDMWKSFTSVHKLQGRIQEKNEGTQSPENLSTPPPIFWLPPLPPEIFVHNNFLIPDVIMQKVQKIFSSKINFY